MLPRTAAALLSVLLATALGAQAPPAATPKAPVTGFRAEFLHQLEDVQKKIQGLAAAIPAEKYAWRPAPGVRSVGEVYMHIAGANFGLPKMLWGFPPPEGVDPRGLEKLGDNKAKVTEALQTSFVHLRHAVESTPDADLDKTVQIFGQPGTVRAAMFLVANHLHEHLGQSIAYARSNGVVPPWSAGAGAAGGAGQ
jgi:uncharacterized damage-inducible protein DinB